MDKIAQLNLPVTHFLTVFTLPHELNDLIRSNQKLCYDLLFQATSRAVKDLCAEKLNILPGLLGVLHTWGQNLSFHPHIHYLIPNGGIDLTTGEWVAGKDKRYLIRPKLLRKRFKKYFLRLLTEAYEEGKLEFHGATKQYSHIENLRELFWKIIDKKWVVWNEAPAKGVQQIQAYLARYVHRVAIADSRITEIKNNEVTFDYKDYRKEDGQGKPEVKPMTLPVLEFMRRFLQHVLPSGFMKVRYYGILSGAWRKRLSVIQQNLNVKLPSPRTTIAIVETMLGHPIDECPNCGAKGIVTFTLPASRKWLKKNAKNLNLPKRAPPITIRPSLPSF